MSALSSSCATWPGHGMAYASPRESVVSDPPLILLRVAIGAKIWVASRLLRESSVSFDVRDLRSVFPDLLEIKPGMKQSATTIDLDVAYEIGRLERQLQVRPFAPLLTQT